MAKLDLPFKKSPWVFHLNTGGCNACDIEILDALTPYHDVERFGMKLVGTPRHADVILLTGPITRESKIKVIRTLLAVPRPFAVLAIGSCAVGGGIWYDSYATIGGLPNLYEEMKHKYNFEPPPTVYIPGCPPRPEAIIFGAAQALGLLKKKIKREEYRES